MSLAIDAAFHAEKNTLSHPQVILPFAKSQVAQRQHNTMNMAFY